MAKRIALRADNNQFVHLAKTTDGTLVVPSKDKPDSWELFIREEKDGKVTLQLADSADGNRYYLSAENGGGGLVLAKRAEAGDWERFTENSMGTNKITLQAANGQFLCAEARGGDLLLANRLSAGEWETFEKVDGGAGRIGLKATNGQFVRAEGGGNGRILVNRDNREAETFVLADVGTSGRVSLQAANARYLCAEGGSGGKVLANRPAAAGDWEQFTPKPGAGGTLALQANPGGKWVQAENGGGAGLLATGAADKTWETFVRTPWYDRPRPRKILVYHGWPSLINGANQDRTKAGHTFSQYEYVVLGADLELDKHPDHVNTQAIISNIKWNTGGATKVFGYLPLGSTATTGGERTGLTLDKIGTRAENWKQLGVDGIFLDEFGMDFYKNADGSKGPAAECRARQNGAMDRVHGQGLTVIANAWDPDHIWDNAGNLARTTLLPTDFYFSESYLIENGAYQSATFWHDKAEKLRNYQAIHDFRILSITTPDPAEEKDKKPVLSAFDADKFKYAWYGAMLYGHEAFGWSERQLSASGYDQNKAEYRTRPSECPRYFSGGITGPVLGNYQRQTDAGTINFNPTSHTAGF